MAFADHGHLEVAGYPAAHANSLGCLTMRIARFLDSAGIAHYGIVRDSELEVIDGCLLGSWKPSGITLPLDMTRLLSPVEPANILCLGKNYRAFAGEKNPQFPKQPLLFLKTSTSVIGNSQPICLPAMAPDQVYFEAELAVVIGRPARNIVQKDAHEFILGYTVANDVGAKDCQAADGQWARAKSFDTFCPLGPWIETELDPGNCRICARVDGELVQDSNTALMIFDVAQVVAFLSRCMTLVPGTVICMGSPGVLREPRPFLRPDQIVEAEINGIGILSNPVKMEPSEACLRGGDF